MHLHYLLHERITKKSRYHGHAVALAFAVTDYKLQGQTKYKLILSIALRLFPPHLDLKSVYVDVSRVQKKTLRALKRPPNRSGGLDYLYALQHTKALAV